MRRDADIVVVGAGIAGAATARALAGYPGSVLLLDQFALGHDPWLEPRDVQDLRLNYPDRAVRSDGEGRCELARRGSEAERGPPDRAGGLPRHRPGRASDGTHPCGLRRAPRGSSRPRMGIALAPLARTGETALFSRMAASPMRSVRTRPCSGSGRTGVESVTRRRVRALASERGSVVLSSRQGRAARARGGRAAGAWAARSSAESRSSLRSCRRARRFRTSTCPGAERLPPLIDYGRLPAKGERGIARVGQSAFSLAAPGRGLKAGLHHSGPATDPDTKATPEGRVAAWAAEWVATRYPDAGETLGAETCLYTNTADEEFVLERHGRVVVGSACSGHGFKFAPIVGRTLAALAREAAGDFRTSHARCARWHGRRSSPPQWWFSVRPSRPCDGEPPRTADRDRDGRRRPRRDAPPATSSVPSTLGDGKVRRAADACTPRPPSRGPPCSSCSTA